VSSRSRLIRSSAGGCVENSERLVPVAALMGFSK